MRRRVLVLAVVATVVVLHRVLRTGSPWPHGLVYALAARVDELHGSIGANAASTVLHRLVRSLTDLLHGMTWIGVGLAVGAICLRWCGARAALVVLGALLAIGVMGLWSESMQTLALLVAAGALSLAIGTPLGTLAARPGRLGTAIAGMLGALETVPVFAYLLVVVLVLPAGTSATVVTAAIYALPPVSRIRVAGTPALPAVNQAIVRAFTGVVLASLVGSVGLGEAIGSSLIYLDVGSATVAAAAIVLLAVALDRASAAARPAARGAATALVALAVVVVASLVARAIGAGGFPHVLRVHDRLVTRVDSAASFAANPAHPLHPLTSAVGDRLVWWLLDPLRSLMVGSPAWLVLAGAVAIALVVAGSRCAVGVGVALAAIGVIGAWPDAMDTASQTIVATALAVALGLAIGGWASGSPRRARAVRPIVGVLSAVPPVVYLVPAIALFSVGRVPGVVAAAVYATAVVIALVTRGLRDVRAVAGAAASSALAVVVVAGLVGGGALGYRVVAGLQANAFGDGVVAGLAILGLAVVLHRMTPTGARPGVADRP